MSGEDSARCYPTRYEATATQIMSIPSQQKLKADRKTHSATRGKEKRRDADVILGWCRDGDGDGFSQVQYTTE